MDSDDNMLVHIFQSFTLHMTDDLRKRYLRLLWKAVHRETEASVRLNIEDMHKRLPFQDHTNAFKPTLHLGQRKLFLCELRLLTKLYPWTSDTMFVYAGAAPCIHLPYLYRLFPGLRTILIDPHKFIIKRLADTHINIKYIRHLSELGYYARDKSVNCMIYNSLFTDETAHAIKELSVPIVFISDIRTKTSDDSAFPSDMDLLWNNCQQYLWIQIIKPTWCMLKFRYIYFTGLDAGKPEVPNEAQAFDFNRARKSYGIDFVGEYLKRRMYYFDGEVWVQPFAGVSSSECRLVFSNMSEGKMKEYNTQKEFESLFFYYNLIDRPLTIHENDNATEALGFDKCGDCAAENAIWKMYKKLAIRKITVQDEVRNLGIFLGQPLMQGPHGHLMNNVTQSNIWYFLSQETKESRIQRTTPATPEERQKQYDEQAKVNKPPVKWNRPTGEYPVTSIKIHELKKLYCFDD